LASVIGVGDIRQAPLSKAPKSHALSVAGFEPTTFGL